MMRHKSLIKMKLSIAAFLTLVLTGMIILLIVYFIVYAKSKAVGVSDLKKKPELPSKGANSSKKTDTKSKSSSKSKSNDSESDDKGKDKKKTDDKKDADADADADADTAELIPPCGEGMQGLVDYPLDASDNDAGFRKLYATIEDKVLVILAGNEQHDELDLFNVEIPVIATNDRCFAINNPDGSRVICTKNQKERNQWINSVTSAGLCRLGVSSAIQEAAGAEEEAPKPVVVKEKAIKIHIPTELDLEMNGHKVAAIARELDKASARKMTTVGNVEEPALTKNVVPPLDLSKQNEAGRTPSLQTEMAIKEALAEHGEISPMLAPKYGYESTRFGLRDLILGGGKPKKDEAKRF